MRLQDVPPHLLTLAQEAETAGLNASAPPQQTLLDGWMIRLSPGKAKRSRCINALAQGQRPLQDLLDASQRAFAQAGLPLVLRLTPFSQPQDLDAQIAALGWPSFDAANVMVRSRLDDLPAMELPAGLSLTPADPAHYAHTVGQWRGSSASEIQAHTERMSECPVPYTGMILREGQVLLACGQFAREGEIAGLYDIFTAPEHRGRGLARLLCLSLLQLAREQGARRGYLQVGSDNTVAQRVYERLGFEFAYRYHYRTPDLSTAY